MDVQPYPVRQQRVRAGGGERDLLVAAFSLAQHPGAVCLQLQDEPGLPRGGVYVLHRDDAHEPALAPRFDELFLDLAHKVRERPALRDPILGLLERASDAARATRPRLEPEALALVREVAAEAAALDETQAELPGAFSLELLLMCCLLIFVSEEERYPRPKKKGSDYTLERIRELI